LGEAIGRLQAKQKLLELQQQELALQSQEEEKRETQKKFDRENPIAKLEPIGAKLLETKAIVEREIKLNPEYFTAREKEYVDKLPPLTAALAISNFEDELAVREEENG